LDTKVDVEVVLLLEQFYYKNLNNSTISILFVL